ncbi:hypothetical protein llap_3739 [Limosa lapponica baueri]|uniref:Uncharacterized protein n=1 Tax=Limosa lapponica baueri TaxID=1758121 RepID=A0A2I0UIU9_LIMLA|nr:hypothetical protein llap_3739 [Limosa lapponica baueri]
MPQCNSTEEGMQHSNLRDPSSGRLPEQVRRSGQEQLRTNQCGIQGLWQAKKKHSNIKKLNGNVTMVLEQKETHGQPDVDIARKVELIRMPCNPRAKQPQLPQLLLTGPVLQTPHKLCCPSLDTLQHLNVFFVVRGPKLDTVLEVGPHQCPVQGDDHFPSPTHLTTDTGQDAVGLLGHLDTLLARVQPAVDQHPQALFCQAALQPLFPKPVALHGVVVTHVQDLALALLNLIPLALAHQSSLSRFLCRAFLPSNRSTLPPQLGVTCKLTEGALNPLIWIIDKDIKEKWPQY